MRRIAFLLVILAGSISPALAQNCEAIKARMYAIAQHAGWGDLATLKSLEQQYNRCLSGGGQQQRRPSCPKGQVLHGNTCMPQGASPCPRQTTRHCAAPAICATDLNGEDRCFTDEGLKQLRVAKEQQAAEAKLAEEKRILDQHIASREARDNARAEAFRKSRGIDYSQWLAKLRELVTLLQQQTAAGDTQGAAETQATMKTTFAPSSTELPPPEDAASTRLKTGKVSERCARNFDLSELWDQGFKVDACTNEGWVIAKKTDEASNLAECRALHPDGTMQIVLQPSAEYPSQDAVPHFVSSVNLTELKVDDWLLGPGDKADQRLLVDTDSLYQASEPVGVSPKPPLRYDFTARSADLLDKLAKGNEAIAQIADKQWPMSLRGSAAAIKSLKYCPLKCETGSFRKDNSCVKGVGSIETLYGNTLVCLPGIKDPAKQVQGEKYYLYFDRNGVFKQRAVDFRKGIREEGQTFPFNGMWRLSKGGWTGRFSARLSEDSVAMSGTSQGPLGNTTFRIKVSEDIRYKGDKWVYRRQQWQKVLTSGQKALVPYSTELFYCTMRDGRI